jgi:uncharacterized membrane protein YbhN (UPF0104 family)
VTYGFGAAGLAGIVLTLALPALTARLRAGRERPPEGRAPEAQAPQGQASAGAAGRVRSAARRGLIAVGDGVDDAVSLLRRHPTAVLVGSMGYMAFDIAVLAACYHAVGHAPSVGVLVVAYIVGQLGGLLPIPGGIGGTEGGLIGMFALYHAPLASTTVAVLAYRAIQLWIPALLGSVAFVQLRNALRSDSGAAVLCAPLAVHTEPVVVVIPRKPTNA